MNTERTERNREAGHALALSSDGRNGFLEFGYAGVLNGPRWVQLVAQISAYFAEMPTA
jgi:hypothetical protein